MEKSKSTKQRRGAKALQVTGHLALPEGLLPWERDLLAALLEAINGSTQQYEKADTGVSS
jgi:hypothetical protein